MAETITRYLDAVCADHPARTRGFRPEDGAPDRLFSVEVGQMQLAHIEQMLNCPAPAPVLELAHLLSAVGLKRHRRAHARRLLCG